VTADGTEQTRSAESAAAPSGRVVRVRIKRQEPLEPGQKKPAVRWEEFALPYQPLLNVHSLLMLIQRNPVNAAGKPTSAAVWEYNCLEGVCGSCGMVINGKGRLACTTLVDQLTQPITLEPMGTFPVVRDLVVDRTRLFDSFKKVKAWVPIDGTYPLGPGPKSAPDSQQERYLLSTCIACGICLEVCPNVGAQSPFVGAAAINQVRLFNEHPTGKMHADQRLQALMEEGGIAYCGNAQNCVQACPKGIPLTESIAAVNGQVNRLAWRKLFRK